MRALKASILRHLVYFSLLLPFIAVGQDSALTKFSLADSNRFGNLEIHDLEGWRFSFDAPDTIRNGISLETSIPASLRDYSTVMALPEWNRYGWFELEVWVDSSIAGRPLQILHWSQQPIKLWLNGRLLLQDGQPSRTPEGETLARYLNPRYVGLILNEGPNYFLIEFSDHTTSPHFKRGRSLENGIFLIFHPSKEASTRRHRAFIFGGAIMLLMLLVFTHLFLAYNIKSGYYIWSSLAILSLLTHAFTTLSDSLINWSHTYLFFFEFSNALTYLFAMYFITLAIRETFNLRLHTKSLTLILVFSFILSIIFIYTNIGFISIMNSIMIVMLSVYGTFSLIEAKKKDPTTNIWILSFGLFISLAGAILYVFVYLTLGYRSEIFFLVSILLAYTAIPIALTLNVANSYASIIETLEEKVKNRTEKLETANAFQKRFFANVSHEFRTPLTISEGLIGRILSKDTFKDTKDRYDLWIAQRNMKRLNTMVNQVIELTKTDHQEIKLSKTFVHADDLVTICVESYRSLAEYRGHILTYSTSDDQTTLHVDLNNTETIVNNLISNAVKYTPDGGTITVRSFVRDSTYVLQVSDDGPGIPEKEREAIFERFHRLNRPEGEYVEGMGIGLELSRTLARLHGGNLTVSSNHPQGSVFELTLPVVHAEDGIHVERKERDYSPNSLPKDAKNTVSSSYTYKILLVEDNYDLIHYISSCLSELGTIEHARNGKEALEKLKTFTPDLILTDLMMPVMGGEELVNTLVAHEEWKKIPVVVLTAKSLDDEKTKLLRIGVVDYITKPFAVEQLLLKARNLLKYQQARKEVSIVVSDLESAPKEDFSERVAACIMEYIQDSNLSVDSIAAIFAMSRSTFYRNLQAQTGMTPAEFIREVRLTVARDLVARTPDIRLEELANRVGYKSATSFRKMYQQRFGEHPTAGG